MIWHFLEVWLLIAVSFAAGCALGAWLYGLLADSPLALAQGAVADAIGDVLDWAKVRLGVGPAWRNDLARSVSRPGPTPPPERIEPPRFDDEPSRPLDPEHEASYVAIAFSDIAPPLEELAADIPDDLAAFEPADSDDEDEGLAAIAAPATLAALPPPVSAKPESAKPEPPAKAAIIPMRPAGLARPRGGAQDNLTRIRGIGLRNEGVLNSLGIFHFSQIAAWTPGEVLWIGRYLAFPERIEHDDWVSQAMVLATGGDTGFEKSADRRRKRRAEKRMQQTAEEGGATETARIEPPRPQGAVDEADHADNAEGDTYDDKDED